MKNFLKKIDNLSAFDKLVAAASILGVIFLSLLFFRKSDYIIATVKVGEDNVQYWTYLQDTGSRSWFTQLFYVGMKEQDGLGRTQAEVLDIRSYDTAPSRKALYLKVKIKAVYNRATNQYTYKGGKVLIGSPIKLNLDKLYVEGLIVHVEGVEDPRERQILTVEAQIREETPTYPESSGTKEYLAEALKVGEEIKDDQGNTVIKILDKKVVNAKKIVTTSGGGIIIGENPLRKDVYLTLEVNAAKIQNRYYLFDDIPILIGTAIPLNTSAISVWPEVTNIHFTN